LHFALGPWSGLGASFTRTPMILAAVKVAVGRCDVEPAIASRMMVAVVPAKWVWPLEPSSQS